MKLFLGLTGVTLVLAMASACGEDTTTAFGGCTPGASQACVGPAGCEGFQVCATDGNSFSPCDCGTSSGTGGGTTSTSTSGTGGSTSTSGTGGDGGSSTSGTAGSGGSTSSGTGGGGGNPTGCPPTQPQESENCTDWQLICDYGNATCDCGYGGWSCYECPVQEPTDGSSCQGLQGADCTYGAVECSCQGYQQEWNCVTCPSTQPTAGDPCSDQGAYCEYGQDTCMCGYNQEWYCW